MPFFSQRNRGYYLRLFLATWLAFSLFGISTTKFFHNVISEWVGFLIALFRWWARPWQWHSIDNFTVHFTAVCFDGSILRVSSVQKSRGCLLWKYTCSYPSLPGEKFLRFLFFVVTDVFWTFLAFVFQSSTLVNSMDDYKLLFYKTKKTNLKIF